MVKSNHYLVHPGESLEGMREAAIVMSTALRGREPTDEELKALEAMIEQIRKQRSSSLSDSEEQV